LKDAPDDYQWQTDPELSDLDAVMPLRLTYSQYLEDFREQLRYASPFRRTFAIETLDGKHIGNCVYYNINRVDRQTEIGIQIGDRNFWDNGYGTDSINTLIDYVFRHTNFKRVYLKTLEKNTRAQKCFQKCGLTPCGFLERDGYRFLLMELSRSRWEELYARRKSDKSLSSS
jgi:RimJ/RimL family protein N-acetyltransferase